MRIFNGQYHGGVEILADEALDDGEIVIQVVTGRSVLSLTKDWFARFARLSRKVETSREFRGSRLLLDTKPHLDISVDGEVVTRTPAIIESAHRVIDVVVPLSAGR